MYDGSGGGGGAGSAGTTSTCRKKYNDFGPVRHQKEIGGGGQSISQNEYSNLLYCVCVLVR